MDLRYVKGKTVEEQIKSLDRLIHYVIKRMPKKIIMGVSPIPISGYCMVESDGTFFRYMSPISGDVRTLTIDVSGQIKRPVTATLTLFKQGGEQLRKTITLKVGQVTEPLAWPVSAGDKIKARVDSWGALEEVSEEKYKVIISELWISMDLLPAEHECKFTQEDVQDEGLPN